MIALNIPGPRWRDDYQPLSSNPLAFMRAARCEYGDVIAFTEELSVFARVPDCAGCVGAFGARNNEQVLRDLNVFGTPLSIAKREALPRTLVNLSSGLFSMNGQTHQHRRRMLAPVFSAKNVHAYHAAITAGCAAFLDTWTPDSTIELMGEMRRLGLYVLNHVLFGTSSVDADSIGALVQELLRVRRAYLASRDEAEHEALRATLIATGDQVDAALRARIREIRNHPAAQPPCLLAQLCTLEDDEGFVLSEDELVAHGHVFYLAGAEPAAVSLAWTVILLSQFPAIREDLVRQVGRGETRDSPLNLEQIGAIDLLDWVVKESLRLLPPNALMLRVTKQPVLLDSHQLPARCEVLLSPYISHREPHRFPRPDEFTPDRWRNLRPSPFEYLPFGAGPKYCMGNHLAAQIIKTALAMILRRYALILADDQTIDWRINVTLMPRNVVEIRVCPFGTQTMRRGRNIDGTLRQLVPSL